MYRISDQQIDYILNDIGARGVEMESLQQNLLDHVCCIIENNLEENGDFESFYQKTIKTFYKDALWEIEEETLQLLIYKNYYTMKKVMIYSGTISVVGFIAGSIFKIMHWPGASAFIQLAVISMSFIFLPLFYLLKAKEVKGIKEKLQIGIGTIFGILFILAANFKIMHWPGANLMWMIALGLLLLVFIPLYFFSGIRNPETKVNTIITTIILIAAGGMLFALTSLKSSTQVYIAKMHNYIQGEELLTRMQMIKKDSLIQNSEIENLSKEINANCMKLKSMILMNGIGQNNIPTNFESIPLILVESGLGDNFNGGEPGDSLIHILKDQVNSYNTSIAKVNPKYSFDNEIERMLDMQLLQQSNYNLLNTLNQIQLFVLVNEK
jgi:hypothetical protein